MQVFVLDKNKKPLAPCHPARARKLLSKGKAAVYRHYPFTIILKREGGEVQPVELKIDPGSKTTGIALVQHNKTGKVVIWAANLEHRGSLVKDRLLKRKAVRQNRRSRKTRYRQPRFLNRTKPKGWLPPSLMSRVYNVQTWTKRLIGYVPITSIEVETVRFDTQLMENPDISGIEYQQGELYGYEVKEYLLEKWGRNCVYCGVMDVPLQVEHIIPKSRGGSNRVSNLTIACRDCNQEKGSKTAKEYGHPHIQAKKSMRDVAAVNATRYAIGNVLKAFVLPVSFWSGGRTKFNRVSQGYKKDHWIDAACVGITGQDVIIPTNFTQLNIKAVGRGSRQMCAMDKYGFPKTKPKGSKRVKGFQTGDIVKAVVPRGKYTGIHSGKVVIRKSGSFTVNKIDINYKYCALIQSADGYTYKSGESK